MNEPTEAMASYRRGLEIRERLVRDHPTASQFQHDLAESHYNVGILLSYKGVPTEAMTSYRRAIEIRERLARDNPTVSQFQRELADSHYNVGILLSDTGKWTEAMASYRRALRSASNWPVTIPPSPNSSAT